MSASFILLDIGGTDIKTAYIETGTTQLRNISRVPFPDFIPSISLEREVDSSLLLNRIESAIQAQIIKLTDVAGILISGQMACWTVTETFACKRLQIVSWQDNRSDLNPGLEFSDELLRLNGGELQNGLPALGLISFINNIDQITNDMNFETMTSWISRNISSDPTFTICHITDAAATGLVDIYCQSWVAHLLDPRLTSLNFPKITKEIEQTGTHAISGSPIYVPVADQQASLLGAGLIDSNVLVNIGTGGQVASKFDGKLRPDFKIRPYFQGEYISTRTHLPAGRFIASLLQTLNQNFDCNLDYEDLSHLELLGSDLIPIEKLKPELCKKLIGDELDKGFSLEEIVPRIMKSIGNVYIETIRNLLTDRHQVIVFAGGVGQKFKNLQDLICLELNMQVEIAETDETTLQGLARLAYSL